MSKYNGLLLFPFDYLQQMIMTQIIVLTGPYGILMAKSIEAGPWWSRSRVHGHPTPLKCLWGTSAQHVQQMTCMGSSQLLGEC